MEGHAEQPSRNYRELAKQFVTQSRKAASPHKDDHQLKDEDVEVIGDLALVCQHVVQKCLCVLSG